MQERKWKILVVDDEPANLGLLGEMLQQHYSLSFATDGAKALQVAEKVQPDLILLDIMMPEMDGYEVCRRLKASESTASILVIFVTAKTQQDDEQRGLELGAVDYIVKPISRAITLARIKNHLELKQARDHLEELVEQRTAKLQLKMKELEARDRLIRFQMQDPDTRSASRAILKEIGEVVDVEALCMFFPRHAEESYDSIEYDVPPCKHERIDILKTETALELVADTFREKRIIAAGDNLMASPILYEDEVLAVVCAVLGESAAETKDDTAGVLWRMANEAAMVLRMANFSEDLVNGLLDFDSLLNVVE